MNQKRDMGETRFADIEETQKALRVSIAESKALAEQSDQLIARNRSTTEETSNDSQPV